MAAPRKPGILTGLLVGALVTAPLIALFFLADILAGLPLLPFDVTDWSARNLPGWLITTVIDTMVGIIRGLNLGRTDVVAKLAEQVTGVLGLFAVGVVGGAVAFQIFNRLKSSQLYLAGLIGGAVFGVLMAALSASVNFTATTPAAVNFVFIVVMFVLWGLALASIYTDLNQLKPADAAAAAGVGTTPSTTAPAVTAETLNRRQFLVRVGGATATLTVVGAGLSALLSPQETTPAATDDVAASGTPEAAPATSSDPSVLTDADGNLVPAPGTRPEYTPVDDHYLISISTRYPVIDGATWTLPITGLVRNPKTYTLQDLRENYAPVEHIITMACISNPLGGDLIGTTRWTGVPLSVLLDELEPSSEAQAMLITAADGFDEYLDLSVARTEPDIMLCYAWDGEPLTTSHGFPLRIYIPNRFGMKQPRWITGIEFVPAWDEGYWVRRGWSEAAYMRATAVIDTVAVDDAYEKDGAQFIPLGGIAFAGPRGISKVEVNIDDGGWVEAQLREPLSDRTWVLWRYDWQFTEGTHNFRVRCYEGDGTLQIEDPNPVRPDGATGIHRVSRSI